jgi:hypothetical protein
MIRLRAFVGLVTVLLVVAGPAPVLAWGPEGHAIVADIAEAHLTPAALRRVTEILRGERLRDVASYADQIRLAHREQTRWHFINFEPGTVGYQPERDCKSIEGQGDCIIAAIARKRLMGLLLTDHFNQLSRNGRRRRQGRNRPPWIPRCARQA